MPTPSSLRWYYFIPLSCEEGRRWYTQYLDSSCMELTVHLDRALGLLRSQRIEEGRAVLTRCGAELDRLRGSLAPELVRVAERWYFSTSAYHRYVIGEGEMALWLLNRAVEALVAAIRQARFLVVLAGACCEFELHRARIARSRRDWTLMHEHLESGRAMVENRRPLCWLSEHQPIYFRDLDSFYRRLEDRCPEERATLAQLTDPELRARGYELQARRVELVPNVVVPFA